MKNRSKDKLNIITDYKEYQRRNQGVNKSTHNKLKIYKFLKNKKNRIMIDLK